MYNYKVADIPQETKIREEKRMKEITTKFYHGEKQCPYIDFKKTSLWQAERMSQTQSQEQKQAVIQRFLDEAYDLINIPKNVSLTLKAYVYDTCMHLSQKTAIGTESNDSLVQSAIRNYKIFTALYEK